MDPWWNPGCVWQGALHCQRTYALHLPSLLRSPHQHAFLCPFFFHRWVKSALQKTGIGLDPFFLHDRTKRDEGPKPANAALQFHGIMEQEEPAKLGSRATSPGFPGEMVPPSYVPGREGSYVPSSLPGSRAASPQLPSSSSKAAAAADDADAAKLMCREDLRRPTSSSSSSSSESDGPRFDDHTFVCEHNISIQNENGAREINQDEVRRVEGTVESLESTVSDIDAVPFADLANSDAMKWLGISCGFIASMRSAGEQLNRWHGEDKGFLEHFQALIERAVAARKVCATIHDPHHAFFAPKRFGAYEHFFTGILAYNGRTCICEHMLCMRACMHACVCVPLSTNHTAGCTTDIQMHVECVRRRSCIASLRRSKKPGSSPPRQLRRWFPPAFKSTNVSKWMLPSSRTLSPWPPW